MTNLSQITVKDLLENLCKQRESTQLQNAPPSANIMDGVKSGTVDTPANANSEGDKENAKQEIITNIIYPTHE